MHVFIVYAHPSEDSFTRQARDKFIEGLLAAGHSYVLSDLYKMNFKADLSEAEYLRDANYRDYPPVAADVLEEQRKINACDALVFIYPVFWTEAPAKLVGWFDRVWTYGFAYGERGMKRLDKALCLCIAGKSPEDLERCGELAAMRSVMLGDRIADRAAAGQMIVLGSTAKKNMQAREANWDKNLQTAFRAGLEL
ncbi:MAG: NAD(P)H-dependent oxidoreductase [Deltaproteobacteria bacterium]|jgi:NAD(P)H dehydrogenase (quinone)|nr:NAD(P)H-dependent oxidoreductase [Deltaproteobacteria bacterium]